MRQDNFWRNKRFWPAALALVLFALALFLAGRDGDRLSLELDAPSFYHLTEETAETPVYFHDAYGWVMNEAPGAHTASLYSLCQFERGTYQFTITTSPSAASEDYFLIYDTYRPGPENQPHLLYAKHSLGLGQVVQFNLTFDRTVPNAVMAFTSSGDLFSLSALRVESLGAVYGDSLFLALFCLLFGGALLWLCFRKSRPAAHLARRAGHPSKNTVLVVCVLAALVATLPMMQNFLYNGHDLNFHLIRIEGIAEGLLGGQFPVRLNPVHGLEHGYAGAILYPDLFLYIPALLRVCGLSMMASYQFFLFLINLATAFVAYQCGARLLGSPTAALLASVVYTLGLYRLLSLYSRAALGEALAMVFLPALALGLYQWLWEEERKIGWLVFGAWGVMNSHVISVLIAALVCAGVLVYNWRRLLRPKRLLWGGVAAVLTLLLCAWNWVPLLSFMRLDLNVLAEGASTMEMKVSPLHLFTNFHISFAMDDTMTRSVGLLSLLGLLLWFCGKYLLKDRFGGQAERLERIGNAGAVAGLGCLLAASALMPWDTLLKTPLLGNVLSKIQFPYRFLAPATMALSLVTALAVYRFAGVKRRQIGAALAVLCAGVVFAFPLLDQIAGQTADTYALRDKHGQLSTIYPPDYLYYWQDQDEDALQLRGAALRTLDNLTFEGYQKRGTSLSFNYQNPAAGEALVETPLYYYPGYTARDEAGNALTVARGQDNFLVVELPAGAGGHVSVAYTGLWYFHVAFWLSALTAAGLAGFLLYRLAKRERQARTHTDPA